MNTPPRQVFPPKSPQRDLTAKWVLGEMNRAEGGEVSLSRVRSHLHADPMAALHCLAAAGLSNEGYGGMTIHSCLSHLGLAGLRQMLGRLEDQQVPAKRTSQQAEAQAHTLWIHSVETAVCARFIAEEMEAPPSSPEEAYLFGLLHDVGRYALLAQFPEQMEHVDEVGWRTPTALLLAEQEVLGSNHAEAGYRLCQRLGVPARMTRLIHRHHEYYSSQDELDDPREHGLLRLIQMADSFSVLGLVTPGIRRMSQIDLSEAIDMRCVHPCWDRPPIASWELASLATRIWEESDEYLHSPRFRDAG